MTRTNQTKRKNKSQKGRNIYLEQSPENSYAKKARNPGRDETPRLVDTWPAWDETPDQTPRLVGRWDPRLVDRWDETPDQTPRLVDSWDETPKSVDRRGETRDQTPRGVDRPDETHAPYRSRSLYVEPCSACLHVGHTPYSQRLADSERWDEICTSADKWDKTLTPEDDIPDLDKWDAMLPFLKVVCQSKKSWEARDSGIKFVQQIALHMGRAVLPHLQSLVEIIGQGLYDEISWVRTSTALSLAALAEASAPYGIISFESVIDPLFKGIRSERGETLAAFLKAIGFIIPMMDGLHASLSTKLVMDILIRELQSRDDRTVEIVLKVIKQCVSTEGVEADYIRNDILPEFFHRLWGEYTPFEHRKQLVETTLEIAKKVGVTDIVGRIVKGLKNEVEPCRMVAMKAIEKIVATFGATDINAHLEELLLDGSILYAFQEQTNYDKFNMMLNGFVLVVNCLEQRVKPYIPQICDAMKVCLDNKSCKVRQKAADAISQIAGVLKQCEEEQLMRHLGVVLHEKLAEKCPEVLGSVMEALKAIDQHG